MIFAFAICIGLRDFELVEAYVMAFYFVKFYISLKAKTTRIGLIYI